MKGYCTMETTIRSVRQEVVISPANPTVLIGERINPTGKKLLAASLVEHDMSRVRKLAESQIQDGAGMLDVNVGAAGVDEVVVLPMAASSFLKTKIESIPESAASAADWI